MVFLAGSAPYALIGSVVTRSSALITEAEDIGDHVCRFLGIKHELWHGRMRVREPDIEPDCCRPGGIRYRTEIRSVGETDGRFLVCRYDVARGARADREIMTCLRIARI